MANVYELYNKYIHVNGRWELLSGDSSAKVKEILTFVNSLTASELTALDINDPDILFGYCYNISETFTTDSRFVEGPGITYPSGSCITVVIDSSQKKFKYLGQVFNYDYVESEIRSLETIINNLQISWANITNKPFNLLGEGLEVDNNTLHITSVINEINALKNALDNLNLSWSVITNKPFTNIGGGLSVTEDTLNATALVESINEIRSSLSELEIPWSQILNKPFNEIGAGLNVTNGILSTQIQSVTWDIIQNKPFNTLYSYDFYVDYNNRLHINDSYSTESFYYYDMQELKNIIES